MRIGLTGGIASGKSTASAWWRAQGIPVIDTDALAHQLTAANGPALPALHARFGSECVSLASGLHRPAMRARMLAQPEARRELEAILHPMISAEAERQAAANAWVVFDIPLLVEGGRWRTKVERVLVIDCEPAAQLRRGAARPGWSSAQVEQIMALQASRLRRREAADAWLDNSTDDLGLLHQRLAATARHWGWDVKESRA